MDYTFAHDNIDFLQFEDELELELNDILRDRLPGFSIRREWVDKLQGESYMSFTVMKKGGVTGVNINVSELYEKAVSAPCGSRARDLHAVAVKTADQSLRRLTAFDDTDLTVLNDYESAKKQLIVQVVSVKNNEAMLRRVPHTVAEDLAMVYRILLGSPECCGTILITNEMMDGFRVSKVRLHRDAMKSDMKLRPLVVSDLADLIDELAGPESVKTDRTGVPRLRVVGVGTRFMGASAIFRPDVMEDCAKLLDASYYILPSSIHEVLVLPDDGMADTGMLNRMVAEINEAVVLPSERLSDHAYYYDREHKRFSSL